MPPLRIAVLECDTPLTGTQKKYGGYGGVFRALLKAGATALAEERGDSGTVDMAITTFDVVNAEVYPSLEDVDVILISGSRHTSFDNFSWIQKLVDFVQTILEQDRVRIIGVCFGHQIVGRALGARVDRCDKGWEVSVTPIELMERGKELFGLDKLSLHQMHKDMVYEIPSGLEQLAHSPVCANQGMYAKGRLITVQGHPEFTDEIVTELLEARHASGIFDDTTYKDGMNRVGSQHDGVAIGKAFVKFASENWSLYQVGTSV